MRNNALTMNDMSDGRAGSFCGDCRAGRLMPGRRGRNIVRRHIAAVLTCLALGSVLSGMVPASARAEATLLPGGEYPDAQCTSPMRPFAGDKAWEWDLYRQKMGAYRACVDAYVRRARADIEHIQGKIDKAVREYNREVTMP